MLLYKRSKGRLLRYGAVTVLLLLLPFLALAGTTGKIAGTVENSKTGEPIPGATVRIVGTDMATQTDTDGEYFFISLEAGTYEVQVSVIGYEQVEKKDVRVLLDLTTPVDFEISQTEIPLKRQLKVYAERPPIQKDLTASRATVTSDRLNFLPNAIDVQSILANMAGTVMDSDRNLHVRGGRSGTITYFYDGFSVQDPFVGRSGIRIAPDAIEEINLTLGGFPAEYGEATSGIVNAVSKEGGNEFHGKVKFYDSYSHKYDLETGTFSNLERTDGNGVIYNLSGPVPRALGHRSSFFLSGEFRDDDRYLPHNHMQTYSQTAKFKVQPTPNLKVVALGHYFHGTYDWYEHRNVNSYSYDFNLDGLGMIKREAYLYGLKANYNITEKSVLGVSYNHFYTQTKQAPEHLFDLHWSEWPGYSEDSNGVYNGTIHEDNMQLAEEYFYTGFTYGDDFYPLYRDRVTRYDAVAALYTNQVDKYHQLRVGTEFRFYDLLWDDKQFFNTFPYGEYYKHKPVYSTVYAQEKLELRNLIVNAGLRWDYLNSEVDYWPDVLNKTDNPQVKSSSKSQLSPRLGVSHPISENAVIRFNYGYYFQAPIFQYLYMNPDGAVNTGYPLVGNPDLKPEKTVSYELGLNTMISRDIRLDITVYYKDIENLVASRALPDSHLIVTKFVNEDYASAKGFDVTIEKVSHGNFSGALTYSYMIAKGNASSAYDTYRYYITDPDNEIPLQEYPLDFDQRHTATMTLDYRVPRDWRGKLFGITIPGAWGVNFTGHYGSGLPYTSSDDKGLQLETHVNDGRMPTVYSVDMRFNKDFYLRNNMFLSFFCEVENLFDRRNIIDVYSNTGRPDDDGREHGDTSDPDGPDGPGTVEDVNRLYRLMAVDPQNYSTPRTVRVGLEFNF